ncbi:MAG TPA: HAD hydrolase-like protein [Vicinamibacterales bacterium]
MTGIDAIIFEPIGSLADVSADTASDSPSHAYDDAAPALAELKTLGITLIAASTLSHAALTRFLDTAGLSRFFDDVRSTESTQGDRAGALADALQSVSIAPDRALYITDNAEGLLAARRAGVHGILMMNDPDEAMKLTAHDPAGGIVSLLELPDFVRFVSASCPPSRPDRPRPASSAAPRR